MNILTKLGAAMALTFAAAPAQAAQFIITYTGTVGSAFDYTGEFGVAGSSLSGLDFTAVYTLTSPLPGAHISNDGATTASIYGGTGFGIGSVSPISAVLTIGGAAQYTSGEYSGTAHQANNFGSDGFDKVAHRVSQIVPYDGSGYYKNLSINLSMESNVNELVITHDYTSYLDYVIEPGTNGVGDFSFVEYTDDGANRLRWASGSLNPTRVTIAAALTPGAVPEPATWAMMILGFGMVGGVMRSQRRGAAGGALAGA